jgi:serine/threonine-protein kinase
MIGTRIGAYEVIAGLGAGGMGEVYRAHDTKLGRDVAIKLLPPLFTSDPDRLARFEREARVLASLNHPHIGAIYGLEDAAGVPALVLELVEGDTLADRIARGPIPFAEARSIARQLTDALDAAHAKGIVHRDLKPANIKITPEGAVKVLDFGLAKAGSSDESPEAATAITVATRDGLILGTTAYMSPEQARGRPVDKRTDVWAFGCVLFEMLTGRRPFAGETTPDTIAAILEREPDWSSLPAGTAEGVRHLLKRCLEKDSKNRLGNIGDARVDLDRASSPASPEPTHGASHRRVGLRTAAAAVAIAIGTGAVLRLLPTAGEASRSIAILPFANTSGNADTDYLSDGITESLINTLSQVPDVAVMSRNAVFRFKGRDTDAQAAGQTLKVQSVVTGRVVQRGDELSVSVELIDVRDNRQIWGEQYNRKLLDVLAVQEDISTEIAEKLRFRLTSDNRQRLTRRYTQNTEAYQLYLRGRYHWNKKTADGFLKGIDYFKQAIDIDPNYAPAYAALAAVYNNLANYNFAMVPPREAWSKAKAAAEKAIAIDDTLASAHTSLALVAYQWEWDWATADKEFKRALALDPGSASTYEPGPSSTNHWYAHYLMTMGRTEESSRAGQRALQLDPVDLANNSHQGWHYLFLRQYGRAIEPLQRTIALNPNFPLARWYLGMTHEQTGSFDEAISQFETCVRLTADSPSMLALLGHAYAAAGRKSDAHAMLVRLGALSKEKYVPPYPIAVIHAALGERDQAIEWLENAYEGRDSWMNYLHLDPRLDGLRADPRFVNLVGRMRFTR